MKTFFNVVLLVALFTAVVWGLSEVLAPDQVVTR